MWTRRGVLLGTVGAGAGAVLPVAASGADLPLLDSRFTFASMPDLFNGDVADLSGLPTWDGGANSINDSWRRAIDVCFAGVRLHRPDAVFVAGDLVEGRWNLDTDDRRLFGRVSQGADETSLRQCRSAIRRAGDVYYGHYRSLFRQQGWDLYPAIGDHELLDDRHGKLNERWHPDGSLGRVPDNRYHLVDTCKDVWADHFTRRADGSPRFENRPDGPAASTAYAVSFADVLTLITVDMFTRTPKGVRLGVFDHQLAWLRAEITRAKRRGHLVIVQGHIPAVNPYRKFLTGNLHVPEGLGSSFYRALDECGADFLFTGEVHDTTVLQKRPRAPIQISHGCIFRYGFNYLIGNVSGDGTLTLDYFEVPLLRASRDHGLWCTDRNKRQRTTLGYGVPLHRGRIVHSDGRMTSRTRKLGIYHSGHDPYEFATHLPTVLH